jgi:hypothetical protein
MKATFLALCLIAIFLPGVMANNVTMSNISLDGQTIANHSCNIKFNISWDNSWRTSTTVPGNWDACWVFAKYRVAGGPWHHCTLSTNVNDYTCPGGCTINPASDGKGVFIYRSQDGNGTNNWTLLTLRWKYGLDGVNDDAEVEVKLFAIEMVYIDQENFYIGDGVDFDESLFAFHSGSNNHPVQINSTLVSDIQVVPFSDYDDTELINGIGIDGDGGIDPDNNGTIDNAFYPTGYMAFYIMKYELSQEQYMEFLNTLTRSQQQARIATSIAGTSVTNVFVMSNTGYPATQNGIRCAATIPSSPEPVTFFCDLDNNGTPESCDGQTLTCNMLSWPDACAYADWAGLRPMSELEFEKATRGPNNPVYGEYAWGNANIAADGSSCTNYGCPNSEIHLIPDQNTGRAYYNYTFISSINLLRCGEFASSSVNHTRQEAGAGFYGVMEMSGSLTEAAVCLGNAAGRSFRAIDGNGELNTAGDADVDYWPGINGNNQTATANGPYGGTTGVTQSAGSGSRGGNYDMGAGFLPISSRERASFAYDITREATNGARCVRSAP